MNDSDKGLGYTPLVREEEAVKDDVKERSSRLLDLMALKGTLSKGGAGVSRGCGDLDPETHYVVFHPWSLKDVPEADMAKAMERLREGLPKQGWKILSYAPNDSPARTLTLKAEYEKNDQRYALEVEFWDERGRPGDHKSLLSVDVVAACHQVPKGKKVEGY